MNHVLYYFFESVPFYVAVKKADEYCKKRYINIKRRRKIYGKHNIHNSQYKPRKESLYILIGNIIYREIAK